MQWNRLPANAQDNILSYSGFYGCLLLNNYKCAKKIRTRKPLYMELEIKYENSNDSYLKCVIHFDGEWKFGIVKSDGTVEQITWMFVSNYHSLSNLLHQPVAAMFNEKQEPIMVSCWYSFEPLQQTFSMGKYAFVPKKLDKCAMILNTLLSTYIQIDEMKLTKKLELPLLTISNMAIAVMHFREFVLVRQADDNQYLCVYFSHDSQLIDLVSTLLLHHKQKFHISSDFTSNLWLVGYGKQREFTNGLQSLKETRFQ
eukprot:NODE_587_length_5660_cov_0.522748.p2 type:complete len:256 gc:universal NODE_587_length_5660_cov_0.522748:419-1186(+)